MDFKLVIDKLLTAFQDEDIHYALIGGFALGVLGITRATVDIDFLVHRDDLDKVHRIMTGLGYDRAFHTDNVSQYVSADNLFGEVDFLHAFREISIGMLQRAENKKIFDFIKTSGLNYDQVINEYDYTWVHISLKKDKNRKQILAIG